VLHCCCRQLWSLHSNFERAFATIERMSFGAVLQRS
jgi:hypothetical protein